MDFTLDDEQRAIAELADRILAEQCSPETLRSIEQGGAGADRYAADAWAALAGADLLGLALPEADGGSGRSLLDAALVAEQVGRHVALVPYWSSTAAALAVARWGSDEHRAALLPGAISGRSPLAVAIWESPSEGVSATAEGDGWRLHGTKRPVPWAGNAGALVLEAQLSDDRGAALFVVDGAADGVEREDELVITYEPTQTVHFDGVAVGPADRLGVGSDGRQLVAWLTRRTTALLTATMLGVCEEALALTARYVSEREQFGAPIGTFQAVAHRCADAYIDTEAMRLTTLQALWLLDSSSGRDGGADIVDTDAALAVAAFWAAEGGQQVVHAAQHLHGGVGVDVDYPVHRYYRWAKVLELLLGGAHRALDRLGRSLATSSSSDDLTS